MIIITSGAYLQGELKSEFGNLPPVYLPLGNKPLLHYQIKALRNIFHNENIILTLPESFQLTSFENELNNKLNINIIPVPDELTLSSSILYAININGSYDEPVRILHGDTLIFDLPTTLDCLSIADSEDNYDWYRPDNNLEVWSGFFAFQNTKTLVKMLSKHSLFSLAVSSYNKQFSLKEIKTKDWLDFGHLNTYFAARKTVTTQRAFNSLRISEGIVTKSGTPAAKIQAEGKWFNNLPLDLKPMTPALYKINDTPSPSYSLEYLPLSPLNELYVYGRHNEKFWYKICRYYNDWFNKATKLSPPDIDLNPIRTRLIKDKTYERLAIYSEQNQFNLDHPLIINGVNLPSLKEIAEDCIQKSLYQKPITGVFHGDPCFSNALYDGRNGRLRLLDPRGINDSQGLIGDIRYDLAKIMHSFIGLYDFIIAKKYNLNSISDYEWNFRIEKSKQIDIIIDNFLNFSFDAFPKDAINQTIPDMILLFISMLPLHSDDSSRQKALLCNALRLYVKFFHQDEAI
ncbi:hypothetical protein [Avibacterium sp. 21-594]|uniref:hypothetical protein n=1 Tax=Avibacterium sp. 21-594 TaxID=2911535 RepID=UPI002246D15C|nr:hypothetical protein [Avibacterium sp. 21-594]MCW9715289.1 hypothetical protein [Avibacterium sp. 21-594]